MKLLQIRDLDPEEWPWDLLLDADPSRPIVESYIHDSVVLGIVESSQILGVLVLQRIDGETCEIKNVAVTPERRGQGLARKLLAASIDRARLPGVRKIVIGTGNAGIGQLALYQKAGFRMESIDFDYFVRTYPEPIIENGIPCRDRVNLAFDLEDPARNLV